MTHDRSSLWVLPLFALTVAAPFSLGAGSVATALILAAALLRLLVDREHAVVPPPGVLWSLGLVVGITALATLFSAPFPMRWDKWAEETWIKLLLIAVPVLSAGAPQRSRRVVQVALVAGAL